MIIGGFGSISGGVGVGVLVFPHPAKPNIAPATTPTEIAPTAMFFKAFLNQRRE